MERAANSNEIYQIPSLLLEIIHSIALFRVKSISLVVMRLPMIFLLALERMRELYLYSSYSTQP